MNYYRTKKGRIGQKTRGLTCENRLRQTDVFICMAFDWLIRRKDAIFIDLGFGRYPTTTIETYRRLAGINPDIRVIGVEIDTERLLGAKRYEQSNVEFRLGGFNLHKEYGYNLIQTKRLLKRGFLIVK
jgi:tRNA G46 methylase TrmB